MTQPYLLHSWKKLKHLLTSLCLALLSACSSNEATFSSFPGFQEYFQTNQPKSTLPSAEEQQLLQRYRPRIYLAAGQTRFIDFYQDYIAQGELYQQGKLVSAKVDSTILNQYRNDPSAEFRHKPHDKPTTPIIYGKVEYDTLSYQQQTYPLTFLNYNLVFAHSGVLKGLPGWQKTLLKTTGWHKDWHQLDHYVGLSVVLFQEQPLAVVLQQHNYQTTYLPNKEGEHGIPWPDDQRVKVDVAFYSNELYPHQPEETQHPGVSFISADNIEFIKTGKSKPMMAGFDITDGAEEQDYTLKFLPPSDAFYTFKGRLGAKRSLPGRDGPPGANYVTLPGLMPWSRRFVTGYRSGSVTEEKDKLIALFDESSFSIKPAGLDAYHQDFVEAVFQNK